MTKKKRYKRYSPEFKREALKRASEEGVRELCESVLMGCDGSWVLQRASADSI